VHKKRAYFKTKKTSTAILSEYNELSEARGILYRGFKRQGGGVLGYNIIVVASRH
jgi:hypothetical protein